MSSNKFGYVFFASQYTIAYIKVPLLTVNYCRIVHYGKSTAQVFNISETKIETML